MRREEPALVSNSIKSPDVFEWRACEICGSESRHLVVRRADLFLGGETLFSMYECEKCCAIYQFPRPTPQKMMDYYPSSYQQYTKAVAKERWLKGVSRYFGLRKRCQVITKLVKQGTILDVGCATGDFLSVMREFSGWHVVGIEPSYIALTYARRIVGLPVIEGVLNVAPFADQSFDAITMWDVLEHVYDPRKILQDVARLLKPGGIFVVNHPNLASIDRKLFGDMWLGYELPRHLYLFPSDLLKRLMAELDFEEKERRCLYGSHAATFSSVMFLVEKRLKNPKLRLIARKVLFNVLTRLLFLPYFKLIDHFNLGSNITAVFVKSANQFKSVKENSYA